MSVKTGRFYLTRGGVEVPATARWSIGPSVDSAQPMGADATVTWHDTDGVTAVDRDHIQDAYDGQDVEVWWTDDEGGDVRVLSGFVDSTGGASLAETSSQLSDWTGALARSLDLRPVAWTLPVHPELSGAGGKPRHVGLFPVWQVHQAMTTAGFDPGVPMHWSSVWYQSMCGSIACVPDRFHAYASLGELRQGYRLSNDTLAPTFPQGDTQRVAADVFAFGVTSAPRPGTESEPWQVTWDMGTRVVDPTYGSEGEILLRDLSTGAGVVVEWTTTQVLVRRHASTGTRTTLGTYSRGTNARFSLVVAPSGSNVILRGDVSGTIASGLSLGGGVTLPTGVNGLCTVRITSPGMIGPVAVTRGDWTYMTTDQPRGRIYRHSMTNQSLFGVPYFKRQEAGRILADQADAIRGLRAQPLWQWVNGDGVLVNTDFDSLAVSESVRTFDTRPSVTGGDTLALDTLAWQTKPGSRFSTVEVEYTRAKVTLRNAPTLLLAAGSQQRLENGDEYEVFLHPEAGTFWLEPDLRPLMAGYPYPSPPFPARYAQAINQQYKSVVGGYRIIEETGDARGWIPPYQLGWTASALGHVQGAMDCLDPDTVLVSGTALLPQGPPQLGVTVTRPESPSLWGSRKGVPLPELRGSGMGILHRELVEATVDGVDPRHAPYRHDCGVWVQSRTAASRIASYLHDAITRPTPVRTATVEVTGRVHPGDKITLVERRPNGLVVEEDVVLARLSGSSVPAGDAMTVEGIVTARRVTQTDPNGPEPGSDEEWDTPPPDVDPEPEPGNGPPPWEGDIPDEPPPVGAPGKPSTPMVASGVLRSGQSGLVVSWDGLLAAGGSAVDADYATTEVALEEGNATPTEVVGTMQGGNFGTFRLEHPLESPAGTWYTRIRTVDRWGTAGAWSDAASTGATAGENLLDNPQTRFGYGGWGGFEPAAILGPHPTGGNGVLVGTADGTNHPFGVNRWVPCEEGESFDLECWFRRVDVGSGSGVDAVRLSVVTRAANGAASIWNMGGFDRTELELDQWTRFVPASPAIAPAGAVEMRFEVWLMGDYTSGTVQATACSMVSRGI